MFARPVTTFFCQGPGGSSNARFNLPRSRGDLFGIPAAYSLRKIPSKTSTTPCPWTTFQASDLSPANRPVGGTLPRRPHQRLSVSALFRLRAEVRQGLASAFLVGRPPFVSPWATCVWKQLFRGCFHDPDAILTHNRLQFRCRCCHTRTKPMFKVFLHSAVKWCSHCVAESTNY